jgi:hypothetical protein
MHITYASQNHSCGLDTGLSGFPVPDTDGSSEVTSMQASVKHWHLCTKLYTVTSPKTLYVKL